MILALSGVSLLLIHSPAYSALKKPVVVVDEELWRLSHILVTMGNRVREINTRTGSITWEYVDPIGPGIYLNNAERLPNKHTLISRRDKVFEIDEYGQIVWQRVVDRGNFFYVAFLDAQRLSNGDTLTAGYQCPYGEVNCQGVLRQYNAAGQLVRSYFTTLAISFEEADRLENGNTLLSSDYVQVVTEIDPNNNVVWSYGGYPGTTAAFDCDRLSNGNTLISVQHFDNSILKYSVREITQAGNTVWQYSGLNGVPEDADRLPDGTTLIADRCLGPYPCNSRIFVVNSAGQILWQYYTPYPPSDVDAIPDAYILP